MIYDMVPFFQVAIEAVYFINGSKPRVSDLIQSWDETKQISAVSRFEDGISYQYIFNDTSKTFMFVNGKLSFLYLFWSFGSKGLLTSFL